MAVANPRQAVAVLVALDHLLFELLGDPLVPKYAGHVLPKVSAAAAPPLRDVHDQPVRTRTDAGVPDATAHQVLAPMRPLGLAARAGWRLHQPARGRDF